MNLWGRKENLSLYSEILNEVIIVKMIINPKEHYTDFKFKKLNNNRGEWRGGLAA